MHPMEEWFFMLFENALGEGRMYHGKSGRFTAKAMKNK